MGTCSQGHDNADGAAFCTTCGESLLGTSPTAPEPSAGEATLSPESSASGQDRKRVLLFAIGGGALAVVVVVAALWVLVLSKTDVPALTGMQIVQAEKQLTEGDLATGSITRLFDDDAPVGEVMEQSPAAGERVAKGSEVTLVVSKGPELTSVTVTTDGPENVVDFRWNCGLAISIYKIAYPAPVLVDQDGQPVGSRSGSWVAGSDNGSYFPCTVSITFDNVPKNRDQYRVNLSTKDPEGNHIGWFTKSEMIDAGWNPSTA